MVFCVVNRSCGETRGSSCSRRRKASIFSLGQSERLAKVRWRVFLPSRQPSRRRMAGGELRLGTTAIYMRTLTNINPNLSRKIYSYMRTQINENQVAARAKPHIFKILTSNRASTVGWNFGLIVFRILPSTENASFVGKGHTGATSDSAAGNGT